MTVITGDHPIKKRSEDLLDRYPLAKHIADGILSWNSPESLCMALHGSWGSGKTSIINLCLQEIENQTKDQKAEDKPSVMHFRPWLFAGQEQIVTLFLLQLIHVLKAPGVSSHAQTAAKYLEEYEKWIDVATLIPKVGPWAERLRTFKKKLTKSETRSPDANKELVSQSLKKLKAPVIIVVDDVDRLTGTEVRQLFQVIKAVADFPRTIYLLAFDPVHVGKALEPFQAGTGTKYLEKIVQLDFEVPSPSTSRLVNLVWKGLTPIISSISPNDDEQHRWNQFRFGPMPRLLRTVRDVKRYLNAVNFKFPMINGEVSSVDLLLVEAFRVFTPPLYEVVRENKDQLVSDSSGSLMRAYSESSEVRKQKEEWVTQLPSLAPSWCRDEIKEMLSLLFPEIERFYKGYTWDSSFVTKWGDNQRICISSYFQYYFRESLPEGEVSAKEAQKAIELVEDSNNLALLLTEYVLDGRIAKLLPTIEKHLEANPDPVSIQNLITAIFESDEKKPRSPEGFASFSDWSVSSTVYRLLRNLDPKSRKKVLLASIAETQQAICFPVDFAGWVWREWNPTEEEKAKASKIDKLFSKEDVEDIQDAALGLIRKHKDAEDLHKVRTLLFILSFWEKWGSLKEVKSWVKEVLSEERNILDFLGGFGTFQSSVGPGIHYQKHRFIIRIESLKRFCNIGMLKTRCDDLRERDPDWLSDDHQMILEAFLKSVEQDQPDSQVN